MRCLTLANALRKQHVSVEFICRNLPGNYISEVKKHGFLVHELPSFIGDNTPGKTGHDQNNQLYADWLEVSQEEDSKQVNDILSGRYIDWLILDHYAIDDSWLNAVSGNFNRTLVIDDLANRSFNCDLLLDQTFGRTREEYRHNVPDTCELICGSVYALLRPEFFHWRKDSLTRRANSDIQRIVVFLGGMDTRNITGKVIQGLSKADLPKDIELVVVLGKNSPNINQVTRQLKEIPFKSQLKININNIAEEFASADLAIGAAGGTSWERCCLGLPSIQMVVADNQKLIANQLQDIGAVETIEDAGEIPELIPDTIKSLQKLSIASSSIADGLGLQRLLCKMGVAEFSENGVVLNPASWQDAEYLFSLQTEENRKYSRNPSVPSIAVHMEWYKAKLKDHNALIFIIVKNNVNMGMIRLDNLTSETIEVSIVVEKKVSGQGIGKLSIQKLQEILPARILRAVVHEDNVVSEKLFVSSQFHLVSQRNGFKVFLNYL